MKIDISIVIVNYRVEKELSACIASILRSKPKVGFEIIVADNSPNKRLNRNLEKISQVKYVRSERNIGFGAGNNLGAKSASGKYLLFLNPDTIVENNSIDYLFDRIVSDSKIGVIGPQLIDGKGKILQSISGMPFLPQSLFVFSFISKIWPNSSFLKKYHNLCLDRSKEQNVDVVSGACMLVSKSLFDKVGGFDERFFMYFEEADFCFRIKKLDYKILYYPKAKIVHSGGKSTNNKKWIKKTFQQSRFKFFKKYHGLTPAFLAEILLRFFKLSNLLMLIILTLSTLLTFYRINKLMIFVGDQGWFYLSARDMLIQSQIPLVGIASSHPWLHQGAFWTYLLAPFLWLFGYNPVSGAYLTAIIGILSVFVMYLVGTALFSKRVGLIASLLYATSPLVVYNMRLPYHTSPIPFFVLLLIFCLHKVTQNKLIYLPLSLAVLSILYNFEIATFILGVVLIGVLTNKLLRKEIFIKKILSAKILILSGAFLIIPLLPMILYDIKNGFPQILKFGAWVLYRIISFFGPNQQQAFSINKIAIMINFLFINFVKLIFAQNKLISITIFIALISWVVYFVFKKKGEKNNSYNLVFLLFFVPLLLVILNQVPSDAYLPAFFPIAILLVSIFLDYIMNIKKLLIAILIFITIMVFSNIYYMFKNDFTFDKYLIMFTLDKRLLISRDILNMAGNKDYNLKGKGPGSEFESFTMNYEYLTWWLGHDPAKNDKKLKIYISEGTNGIKIDSKNNK